MKETWISLSHDINPQNFPAFNSLLVSVVRSDLVEENSGKADAKLGGDDGKTSFGPAVLTDGTESFFEILSNLL